MKRILVTLAMILATLGISFAVPAPANAGECSYGLCGIIKHYSPDAGYDAAIIIRCDWSSSTTLSGAHYLTEGQSSKTYCTDTDQVYMRAGDELWCITGDRFGTYFEKVMDATGWHKIDDLFDRSCVLHKD